MGKALSEFGDGFGSRLQWEKVGSMGSFRKLGINDFRIL